MKERRLFERIRVSLDVKYKTLKALTWAKGIGRDISGRGIRIHLDKELKPGTLVQLKLMGKGLANPITVKGKVIWARPVYADDKKENYYDMGIEFTEASLVSIGKITRSVSKGLEVIK